jgi:hypothetical protein
MCMGVGFFIGAVSRGCVLLAALSWYVLKNDLQSSDRRNILKLPAGRPVCETCRRAQIVSLRSSRCGPPSAASKCKVLIPYLL